MSLERINKLIESLRNQNYKPNPARRVYIEKKNNSKKKRPLGIPSTEDKLVQEVTRMISEAIYEPTFANQSHGFRPKRSCHTALTEISRTFTGTRGVIEGDIKGCFDNFHHQTLIEILRKRIADERFIQLIWKMLKAGYMEQWEYRNTYSGTPQGSGVSPILANIYMSELDKYLQSYAEKYIAQRLVPCGKSTWKMVYLERTIKRSRAKNGVKSITMDFADVLYLCSKG